MDSISFVTRIEQAGFSLQLHGGKLRVIPASKLSDPQRAFIRDHRDELMQALRLRDKALQSSPSGNDDPPANDDRALIHIPEFQLQTGQRVSFDATVPKANLAKLRESVRFTLIDHQGGGSLLGEPGRSREELAADLRQHYGDRLKSIDGKEPGV